MYTTEFLLTVTFMDVPEDMELGLDSQNGPGQLVASHFFTFGSKVKHTIGWTMSDKDIGIHWNKIPFFFERSTSFQIKSPVAEDRLPWAAIKFDTIYHNLLILQVNSICDP